MKNYLINIKKKQKKNVKYKKNGNTDIYIYI